MYHLTIGSNPTLPPATHPTLTYPPHPPLTKPYPYPYPYSHIPQHLQRHYIPTPIEIGPYPQIQQHSQQPLALLSSIPNTSLPYPIPFEIWPKRPRTDMTHLLQVQEICPSTNGSLIDKWFVDRQMICPSTN